MLPQPDFMHRDQLEGKQKTKYTGIGKGTLLFWYKWSVDIPIPCSSGLVFECFHHRNATQFVCSRMLPVEWLTLDSLWLECCGKVQFLIVWHHFDLSPRLSGQTWFLTVQLNEVIRLVVLDTVRSLVGSFVGSKTSLLFALYVLGAVLL